MVGLVVDGDGCWPAMPTITSASPGKQPNGSYQWLPMLKLQPAGGERPGSPGGPGPDWQGSPGRHLHARQQRADHQPRHGQGRAGDSCRRRSVHGLLAATPDVSTSATGAAMRRQKGDPQATTSGTPVQHRSAHRRRQPGHASRCWSEGRSLAAVKTIPVGLHPSGMIAEQGRQAPLRRQRQQRHGLGARHGRPTKVVETIRCRPAARLPFGSGCNALALSPDGGTSLRRQRHQQLRGRGPARGPVLGGRRQGSPGAEQGYRPDPHGLVSRRGAGSIRTARSCSSPTSRATAR